MPDLIDRLKTRADAERQEAARAGSAAATRLRTPFMLGRALDPEPHAKVAGHHANAALDLEEAAARLNGRH